MPLIKFIKNILIGKERNLQDRNIFHHMSLIAFFAWVGLGADGLSSSTYGPEEAFIALGEHRSLGIFVAILSALTVLLISASYCQIIELFPRGGGGYLVASKLLGSNFGMISGCALLIDYVLTITISVAAGADALYSFLPPEWNSYRLSFALASILVLILLNMRGVKESIAPLIPIFLIFLITHFVAIIYSAITHSMNFGTIISSSVSEMHATRSQVGFWGLIFIILKSYSLGAGTFTGIEAVSNGLPILREPRAETGKKTMRYMSWSLAFTVAGLMICYLLFDVVKQPGKTLNAVLFENITLGWPQPWGQLFVLVTLISEAMLLFVAAQAGFLGGPRVLANLARDRWMPSRFSSLSDRLVTHNGIILMGGTALITLVLTKGSVHLLVVLYSINVFITFCLSQAGMVRHWWLVKKQDKTWISKILVSGTGLIFTTFILLSVIILKFNQGGWVTLMVTTGLSIFAVLIRKHYRRTLGMLKRLNALVDASFLNQKSADQPIYYDKNSKTAGIFVNGYNGLGLHTLMNVVKNFSKDFKNFVFIQIGVIDAGNFKGTSELERLKASVKKDLDRYVTFMNNNGYYADGIYAIGTEVVEELENLAPKVIEKYPNIVFFAGHLVFQRDNFIDKVLHNYTVFSIQKRFYRKGYSFMILPIRV